MSVRWRFAFKLAWMAVLVVTFVLLAQVRHDFVYQGF